MNNNQNILDKIKWYPLPEDQYVKKEYNKNIIVLHHTASGGSAKSDVDYWKSNSEKIATAFVIDRDGTIWQCFSSKYYAAHLGTPTSTFKKFNINNTVLNLHKHSIGIELDNWGWLTKKSDGKYYTWANTIIPEDKVQVFSTPYLGQSYFEKYTDKQLESVRELLIYLCDTYKIPKTYNDDMWFISKKALSGEPGIWSHTSYRESGKWDAYPYEPLIRLLNNLK